MAFGQQTATPAVSTIKVDTKLVVVPVTVRDKKNQIVGTLKQEDFAIREDGQQRAIRYFDHDNDLPLTLGLLIDVSMSLRDKLDEERDASAAFLQDMLVLNRDQAFIIQFGHTVDLLSDVTKSTPKLQAALKKVDSEERPSFDQTDSNSNDTSAQGSGGRHHGGGGGTALYDAVYLASHEVIAKQANRKALIVLTDGEDRGSKTGIAGAIEAAQRADTTVYAIYYKGEQPAGGGPGGGGHHGGMGGLGGGFPGGFPGGGSSRGGGRSGGPEQQHVDGKKILERVTGETGGRFFEVSKKDSIDQIYKQIAEELRSQYRLGFTPADAAEGYHQLDITIPKDGKLRIQARDGYYAGEEK